jgi:hypothetical protein
MNDRKNIADAIVMTRSGRVKRSRCVELARAHSERAQSFRAGASRVAPAPPKAADFWA